LIERLIPVVRSTYPQRFVTEGFSPHQDPGVRAVNALDLTRGEIQSSKSFVPYLQTLDYWLTARRQPLPAEQLRDFYRSFFGLARRLPQPLRGDTKINRLGYLVGKFGGRGISHNELSHRFGIPAKLPPPIRRLYAAFALNIERIERDEVDDIWMGRSAVGGLMVLFEDFTLSASQAELNAAKQALLPLWKECRFEMSHILPLRSA
jgi:hypothetical protein